MAKIYFLYDRFAGSSDWTDYYVTSKSKKAIKKLAQKIHNANYGKEYEMKNFRIEDGWFVEWDVFNEDGEYETEASFDIIGLKELKV